MINDRFFNSWDLFRWIMPSMVISGNSRDLSRVIKCSMSDFGALKIYLEYNHDQ
uniref:Uncharacterized protein n=1 Tax=Arundo donax TaxID=35708 RepID=A0A0A8YH18_ARUDO